MLIKNTSFDSYFLKKHLPQKKSVDTHDSLAIYMKNIMI